MLPTLSSKIEYKILVWNISGFRQKINIPEVQDLLESHHIICLSETWLDSPHDVEIKGYSHISITRKRTTGARRNSGGVSILYRNDVDVTHISNFVNETHLWVRILTRDEDNPILLCAVYIPPESSKYADITAFDSLEQDMVFLRNRYPNCDFIIAGDFNARTSDLPDFIDENNTYLPGVEANGFENERETSLRFSCDKEVNNYGRRLLDLCKSTSLRICNGRFPPMLESGNFTYVSKMGSSIIDYVIVSQTLLLADSITNFELETFCFSDHFPITFNLLTYIDNRVCDTSFATYNDNELTKISKYKWYAGNINDYLHKWQSHEVDQLINSANVFLEDGHIDSTLSALHDIFEYVYGKKYVKGAENTNMISNKINRDNWFDYECKNFKQVVNRAMRKYRVSCSHLDRQVFCTMRRNYKRIINRKKNEFYNDRTRDIMEAAKQKDSKKIWSYFGKKNFGSNEISCEKWFTYFRSVFCIPLNSSDEFHMNGNDAGESNILVNLNRIVERDEVVDAVKNMKNGKACGIDGVLPEIIKNAPNCFIDILYELFSKCLSSGVFPDEWKIGLIHPVYKKGNKNDPASYRPIMLLCTMSKLFSRILSERLYSWLEEHNILSPAQAGFRKHFSTIDNGFVINTAVTKALRAPRGKLYAAFIDLKAAFDNLDRNILFSKLSQIGIRGKFLNILCEIYSNVRARVKCKEGLTPEFKCTTGVRQGDNLSPLLFSLYLNDLEEVLSNCTYPGIRINNKNLCCLLYADDIVIFSYNAFSLQKLLDEFERYCVSNKLTVNKDKSKIIVFRKGGYIARHERFSFQGIKLEAVNSFNYLGLTYTPKGIWHAAQNNLSSSAKKAMFALKCTLRNLHNLPVSYLLQVFDSKILPILSYGAELWGAEPRECVNSAYIHFHKFVLGLPYRSTNILAIGELGRPNIKYFTYLKQISYWLKLLSHDENRFTKICLAEQTSFADNNYPSWGLRTKSILCNMGFAHVWYNQGVTDPQLFLEIFKQRLQDIDMQDWASSLNDFDYLRTYKLLKSDKFVEPYIIHLNDFNVRKYLARLRCGYVNINVNIGRINNTRFEERVCTYCNCNSLDDEFHFLLVCTFHDNLRKKYIPSYYTLYPDLHKFRSLVNSDCKKNCFSLAKFVKHALESRRRAL